MIALVVPCEICKAGRDQECAPDCPVRLVDRALDIHTCAYQAQGFCGASVDGYCVGGTSEGICHG